jgi:hypothetical protein
VLVVVVVLVRFFGISISTWTFSLSELAAISLLHSLDVANKLGKEAHYLDRLIPLTRAGLDDWATGDLVRRADLA